MIKIKNRYNNKILSELHIETLIGANLYEANLYEANLYEANLTGANLTGANLYEANLTRANLTGANLYEANLTGANLTGANLTGANLTGANLTGANLYEANLYEANLTRANLTGANLTGANLYEANLTRANLTRANLTGANLTGANLTGANLTGANLEGTTNLPTKFKCSLSILTNQKNAITAYKFLKNDLTSPYQNFQYEVGKTYKFAKLNTDIRILCGEGGNVATLDWCLYNTNINNVLVEVEIPPHAKKVIPYNSNGKFRVNEFTITRILPKEEVEENLKSLYTSS